MKIHTTTLLLVLCVTFGCYGNFSGSGMCEEFSTILHSDLTETFALSRKCDYTDGVDISTLEASCSCDHKKSYGGVKTVKTISCGGTTLVEESYPYYGLWFRYKEGILIYVGGKEAPDTLRRCYNEPWSAAYNTCQTKVFMYCL